MVEFPFPMQTKYQEKYKRNKLLAKVFELRFIWIPKSKAKWIIQFNWLKGEWKKKKNCQYELNMNCDAMRREKTHEYGVRYGERWSASERLTLIKLQDIMNSTRVGVRVFCIHRFMALYCWPSGNIDLSFSLSLSRFAAFIILDQMAFKMIDYTFSAFCSSIWLQLSISLFFLRPILRLLFPLTIYRIYH